MFTVRPIQCLARAHAHRLLPYSCKHTLETFQSPIVEWLSECILTCRLYATNIGGDTVAVMPLCPSCISPYPHSSLFTPLCISALPHSSRVLPHFLPEMHRTKRDVLKQTKKVRWRTRPSQLFLNIFEANDMRNKCGIKLCTRVNNNCSTVVEMLSIEAVFGTHSSMLCMYLRVDVCKYICWYTVTIEAHVWSVSGGLLSAHCSQIYKRLKGITAEHAMQSVITRFREQPCHDGIFFHVKVLAYTVYLAIVCTSTLLKSCIFYACRCIPMHLR